GAAPEVIVASTAGLNAYDPDSGKEAWNWTWKFDGMALRTVGSPVYGQGLIFAGSGDGSGARHLVAVKPGGKGDGDAAVAWEKKAPGETPYVPCMLPVGEHLHSVNDKGFAACHVAKTGEQVWSRRLGGSVFASPILVNGNIYSADVGGDVYVFPAAPEFKLLATNS